MLRLNMAVPVAAAPSRLGVLAGDLQGFPNGRRLTDDVIDIAVQAVEGAEVDLTAKEFDLLLCLLENAGRVLTRSELKELVWDFRFDAQTKVVDLYVHYLRKKLGDAGDIIQTVRGVGYSVGR
jgi:DNA-binding response OmpR family regulator